MSLANEKIVLTLRGDFTKDPLLYNVCMIKIWSTIINLKFGHSTDKELLEYIHKIDDAVSEIKEDVLKLMLEKPEKLSN
jgi:hypothetical protein